MSDLLARESLARIEDYQVETVPDADIVVNANETNWDMTPEIRLELGTRLAEHAFNRYPSMHGEDLCQAIADRLGFDPSQVAIGNGSSELLEKACFAFGGAGRKIASANPSFSMYQTYAILADSQPVLFPLTADGFVDPEGVISFCKEEKPALLIICNPNNPTGNFNPKASMEKIIRSVDCPVIMDEAYMEFAVEEGKEEEVTTLDLVNQVDNLLVLRTFSKAYGLANLRIGYGIGSAPLMKILKKVLLPYTVNGVSILAAELMYSKPEVLRQRVEAVVSGRRYLRDHLEALGFRVLPSATNFLLALPAGKALERLAEKAGAGDLPSSEKAMAAGGYLFQELLDRKILVRNYSRNPRLPGGLRITVGKAEENPQIIGAIRDIIQ
ncbi:aminotransferase class I/II-fold pyridoxal phosphate-dependent enzyme [Acidaminococcus fermentans]|uniref:Histidinol-phosphate aminotransferase n=1 Tax=Acidaminococcus fermentans TaxID=905 RepID=A0A6N7W2V5_ACIFE|nr:aminotransferase class I/II-fold pyridoxal phosphate-dependent enzyme [Acidaminococcus fermentans]MSS82536.1 aminotransferase class I/II-fold pyridoxal phosphate-dependent enzyme [Acidaminococcus fermentans]